MTKIMGDVISSDKPITVQRSGLYRITVQNDKHMIGQITVEIEKGTLIDDKLVEELMMLEPGGTIIQYALHGIDLDPPYVDTPLYKAINE